MEIVDQIVERRIAEAIKLGDLLGPATLRHGAALPCTACVPASASVPRRSLHAAHPCVAADGRHVRVPAFARIVLTVGLALRVATLHRSVALLLHRRTGHGVKAVAFVAVRLTLRRFKKRYLAVRIGGAVSVAVGS